MDANDKLLILTFLRLSYSGGNNSSGLHLREIEFSSDLSKRLIEDKELRHIYEMVIDQVGQNHDGLRAKIVYSISDPTSLNKIPSLVIRTAEHLELAARGARKDFRGDEGAKVFNLDSLRLVPRDMYEAQAEIKAYRSICNS